MTWQAWPTGRVAVSEQLKDRQVGVSILRYQCQSAVPGGAARADPHVGGGIPY
jgi:hypothetical protein